MADEEIQRAIEFIVQQQAQYAARFEKDESRLAKLEESFRMLVELARGADERQDTMGETIATLSHTMNELVQRTITDESRLARLEDSLKMLVELARGTDERSDTLDRTMLTLSHSMNELAQRMITLAEVQGQTDARVTEFARDTDERLDQDAARFEREESRLARLEESFTMLVELAHKHG
jgi:chromosome segregation ATPase